MPIGWIDFSKSERNKVMNVISLLNAEDQGAVDELGIGVIRDAFSDFFFPGTSTVQTRAKYFLIVPYVLVEAVAGRNDSDVRAILRKIDDEERKCRDILIKNNTDGVIGSLVPNSWVVRTPSNIYWNGIRKLGIFRADLSIREYVQQSILMKKLKDARLSGNKKDDAEENERDDSDAGDITLFKFWNLGDTYQTDWRKNLRIELTPKEAAFLKTQIVTHLRGTLFSFVLQNQIDLDQYDSFGAFSEAVRDRVDPELKYMIDLANAFNNLAALITTRYNMIVTGGKSARACERWEMLSKDLEQRCAVDLKAVYRELHIKRSKLKGFLLRTQEEFRKGNIDAVDQLIIKQEIDLKDRKRAKTLRPEEYVGRNWIGLYMLDYRFRPTQRLVRDIMNPKEVPDV